MIIKQKKYVQNDQDEELIQENIKTFKNQEKHHLSPELKQIYDMEKDIYEYWTKFQMNQEIHQLDIPRNINKSEYIHTILAGEKNIGKDLVMLHGYGATGVFYGKMFDQLASQYRIWNLDLAGCGLSSRSDDLSLTDSDSWISFFVEAIEIWRQSVGLQEFTLMGHSLGGYIACKYALKYSQRVCKLELISAAGITEFSEEEIVNLQKRFDNMPFWRRQLFSFAKWMFVDAKVTPSMFVKNHTWIGPWWISIYLQKRMGFQGKEYELFNRYFQKILLLPECGESCLYYIFKMPGVDLL